MGAYGNNKVTSRGTSQKHIVNTIYRKVKAASAAPEIWLDSDDYEDWATTGRPHLDAAPGKKYNIDLLPEGKAVWREVVEPQLADVSAFHIMGSMTNWSTLSLEPSEEVEGLFTREITLGAKGQDSFQIVVNGDPELVLYPEQTLCTRRAAPVLGPALPPSRDNAWVIKGDSTVRYRVEVFKSASSASVSWFKVVEAVEAV